MARASFEELLLDFEDFLRHRRLDQWGPDSAEAVAVRQVPQWYKKDQTDLSNLTDQERWALYAPWLEHEDPVASPWCYGQQEPGKMWESSSGAAQTTLIVKGCWMYDIDRIKTSAARKWVDAVNNRGELGLWDYAMVKDVTRIEAVLGQYVHLGDGS